MSKLMERITMSQAVSPHYCQGYNSAVREANERISELMAEVDYWRDKSDGQAAELAAVVSSFNELKQEWEEIKGKLS
jgi:P2-related tail formation protein